MMGMFVPYLVQDGASLLTIFSIVVLALIPDMIYHFVQKTFSPSALDRFVYAHRSGLRSKRDLLHED
jgi:hypothetical protein